VLENFIGEVLERRDLDGDVSIASLFGDPQNGSIIELVKLNVVGQEVPGSSNRTDRWCLSLNLLGFFRILVNMQVWLPLIDWHLVLCCDFEVFFIIMENLQEYGQMIGIRGSWLFVGSLSPLSHFTVLPLFFFT